MKIQVTWDLDDDEMANPPVVVEVPDEIYEAGMTDWDDPVAEYLSGCWGYLVKDWRVTKETI